jgi:hypothetical protein
VVWWAAFGFVIWALFIAAHAYPPWSPISIGIAVVTAAAGLAWAVVGFRKGYPLRGEEQAETEGAHEQGEDSAASEASAEQEPQAESPNVYTGSSPLRELGQLLVFEVVVLLAMATAAGWHGLLEGWPVMLPIMGFPVLVAMVVGPTIVREARWDDAGVEFRWLWGRPSSYMWDELQKLARPNLLRRTDGTGLLLYTRGGEVIEIKSGGENFAAFSDALKQKLPLEGA